LSSSSAPSHRRLIVPSLLDRGSPTSNDCFVTFCSFAGQGEAPGFKTLSRQLSDLFRWCC
jgi:hypothetical protein